MANISALNKRPRDPDLYEVFDRASWVHAMASVDEFWLWLNHRLELASNQPEQEWLSQLLRRVSQLIKVAENRIAAELRRREREKGRVIRQRRQLLSKITVLARLDVKADIRRENALLREEERHAKWVGSKEYHQHKLDQAEARWNARKQVLIAREEERRKRDSQGRWLISR